MKNKLSDPGNGLHADRYSLYDGDDTPPEGAAPDDGMTGDPDENVLRDGCMISAAAGLFAWLLMAALAVIMLFAGCAPSRYVTVPEVHEIHHYRTDTVTRLDSITLEHTVIVREADSATLAAYGIQLEAMQRAWLIETSRMEREISRLASSRTDTVMVRDSVAVPYPVTVTRTVAAPLSWWQRFRMQLGNLALITIAVLVGWWLLRSRLWQ